MKLGFVLSFIAGTLVSSMALAQTGGAGALQLQTNSKPWPANSSGVVNINITIKDGFKIPKRPSPKLQIDPTGTFEVTGDTSFTEEGQGKDPEYFHAFKPLSLQLAAAKTTQPGRYTLSGKFTYFYCSESEKYCSRSVEKISIPIELVAAK